MKFTLLCVLVSHVVCMTTDQIYNKFGYYTPESRVDLSMKMSKYNREHFTHDRWLYGGRFGNIRGLKMDHGECHGSECLRLHSKNRASHQL